MKTLYNENLKSATTNSQAQIAALPKTERATRAFRETPKYDEKYCREYEATIAGVFFFVVPILFMIFCVMSFVKYEGYDTFVTIISVGALVLRVIATIWVAKLSKELNRNSVQWMAFAFLLPGSALTIIGQKKRLFDPSEWKQHLYNHNRSITTAKETYTQVQPQSFQLAS